MQANSFLHHLLKLNLFSLGFLTLMIGIGAQYDGETLRFRLSAKNLPTMDLDGPSDPYVMIFAATRSLSERHRHWQYIGSTSTKMNTNNPEWNEVFQYQYINGTYQLLRFFVKDQDESWFNPIYAIDEPLGRVEIQVEDYVRMLRKNKQERESMGGNETETSETTPTPLKAIQLFLTHPIGGNILMTPVTD